jgi:hypothetical protein
LPADPNDPSDANDPNIPGFGGAIFCGYESEVEVIDSILWEDYAVKGSELAVGGGFELDQRCGKLTISYSDIMQDGNDVYVENGCELIYGDGILHNDPFFFKGAAGDFFLENPLAGPEQTRRSPAIDAGSAPAGNIGMSRYTTRTDGQPDTGPVDPGYHYPFLGLQVLRSASTARSGSNS